MEEIWKNIVGYEGLYQISNLGRVKSLSRIIRHWKEGNSVLVERILKPGYDRKNGYYTVVFYKEKKAKTKKIHRLVAEAFIPNPENKPCVNHINGNKTDNRLENLEWCSKKENVIHAHKTGLISPAYGSNANASKLTELQVIKIKGLLAEGIKQEHIAKMYNVTRPTIGLIKRGVTWKNVA